MRIIYRSKLFKLCTLYPDARESVVAWFRALSVRSYRAFWDLHRKFGDKIEQSNRPYYRFFVTSAKGRYMILASVFFDLDLVVVEAAYKVPYKRLYKKKRKLMEDMDKKLKAEHKPFCDACHLFYNSLWKMDEYDSKDERIQAIVPTINFIYRYEEKCFAIDTLPPNGNSDAC